MKETPLEKLKLRRDQLDARIQKLTALQTNQERKKDTRRKILVGSYFLDEATKNNTLDALKQKMENFLKRNTDRALFDLPLFEEPKEKTEKKEEQSKKEDIQTPKIASLS